MAGAYVAKAGLNYSLVLTLTGTSLLAGDAVAVIGSFRLNGTSRTVEPADTTVTWTASIAGSAVNLRIDGVGSYGASVTSEAADSGAYWQSSVALEFEDIGAAADQTLTVVCSATIGGITVTDYRTTTVPDYSLVVTGPAQVLTNAAAACVASFRADGTDKTAEPSTKTITWSATIGGNPVNLRVGSSGGYTATATDDAADSGTYWQASSSLEFDLSTTGSNRTMVVTGAGTIEGLAVNDTANITIPGWPSAEYQYDIDLDDVWWGSGDYQWEFRCDMTIRKRSDDSVHYFFRKYIRQLRQVETVEQGVITETNPENDPSDITFTLSSSSTAIGGGPNYYIDAVTGTLNMKVDAQDPLMYYEFRGEIILARTSTGTNDVTHTGTVTDIVEGTELATDTQTGTYVQTSAVGQLKIQETTITRVIWQL
ncbi:hypothetical protein LCGC14_0672450 [marine sediment metagenome]|uniref:Uncharacterized protein n=1 Tax=marine sediment metagenome TaxID=412755 RepID=A0A0F9QQK5_9ZZZZ